MRSHFQVYARPRERKHLLDHAVELGLVDLLRGEPVMQRVLVQLEVVLAARHDAHARCAGERGGEGYDVSSRAMQPSSFIRAGDVTSRMCNIALRI